MQSLKTTAGAMLISAAFFAFRPLLPSPAEARMGQPTQIAREDAADGPRVSDRCRGAGDDVEAVVLSFAGCNDRRQGSADSTEFVAAPIETIQRA